MNYILSILYWSAVIFYALSFITFAIAAIFKKSNVLNIAVRITLYGFIIHTAMVTARWIDTGYPPFVSYFEAMSASAWFGILIYLILQHSKSFIRPAGVGFTPFIFLLMGWGGTHPFGDKILPVSLQSTWLYIHASFATAAVGCFIIATGVAIAGLQSLKNGQNNFEKYEEFNYRLILLGFIFYGIMIISGAIWAKAAWGRYWGWDPIELWSLITWLLYGIYLHIYITWKKLRGKFLAYYTIIALFVTAFSLWGVGILYKTLHTYGG